MTDQDKHSNPALECTVCYMCHYTQLKNKHGHNDILSTGLSINN
jgi:hypothetical protein